MKHNDIKGFNSLAEGNFCGILGQIIIRQRFGKVTKSRRSWLSAILAFIGLSKTRRKRGEIDIIDLSSIYRLL